MDCMVLEVNVTGELSGYSNSVCLGIPHRNKSGPSNHALTIVSEGKVWCLFDGGTIYTGRQG